MEIGISATTALYLLLVANAILLTAAALTVMKMQRHMRRIERLWSNPTGTSIANRKPIAAQPRPQANRHLERRVAELQSVVRTLAKREQLPAQPLDTSLPIVNAVRMARHGASIDDLVRNCGLNIGEARLMQKLHGKAQAQLQAN